MRNESADHRSETSLTASWAAVMRDMRSLATDLTSAGVEVARLVPIPQLPGMPAIDQVTGGWTRFEETFLRELKTRLDRLEAQERERRGIRPIGSAAGTRTAAEMLEDLLTASIDSDSAGSREELYRTLLLHLVPDEARILAALADGTRYPLVHIQSRSNGGRTVVSNASTVGRAAGVQVQDAVGIYVTRLRAMGLAEEGPADDTLAVQYDILLGEPGLRDAEDEADVGRLGTRVVRRTLRISALGRQLWQTCRPDEDEVDDPSGLTDAEIMDAHRVEPAPDAPGFRPNTVYEPSANGVSAGRGPEHG